MDTKNIIEIAKEWNDAKRYIAVDDLIQHIEDSRSPDGNYPDADCIIKDLRELSTNKGNGVEEKN